MVAFAQTIQPDTQAVRAHGIRSKSTQIIGHSRLKLRKDWAPVFSDLSFGIAWVTSVSYNWSMVSKVTVNQLERAKIIQTTPDVLVLNASAQSSRTFWSWQLHHSVYLSSHPRFSNPCDRLTLAHACVFILLDCPRWFDFCCFLKFRLERGLFPNSAWY